MNETRKIIIISEIKYWKENHLLPERYCDFLLTLYSGGEEAIEPLKKQKSASFYMTIWLFTVIFFSTLFVNYFTEFPIGLQITLTAIAIIIFGYFIYRFIENRLLYQLAIIGLALLILVESVNLVDFLFPQSKGMLYIFLLLQCGIWFILGRKLKLLYFSISGVIGALFVFFFLIKAFL